MINCKVLQSRLQIHLRAYETEFPDPDLHFEVPNGSTLEGRLAEWSEEKRTIQETRLTEVKAKFNDFYNSVLLESVKTAINDVRKEQGQIERSVREINQVLKASDYERLPTERRYLQISADDSIHEWVRKFNSDIRSVSDALRSEYRKSADQHRSDLILGALQPLVDSLHGEENQSYFEFVRDIRNHFRFSVLSYRRGDGTEADQRVESFTGSRKDAKSSAQTTQLAYVLLASALAYRFNFRDPIKGKNSLRLIVLDEFGGKFDNEKPKDIVQFLDDMGFQSIFVSPMSKADLLAPSCGQLVLVHKASASDSKLGSTEIQSGNLEEACRTLEEKMNGVSPGLRRRDGATAVGEPAAALVSP